MTRSIFQIGAEGYADGDAIEDQWYKVTTSSFAIADRTVTGIGTKKWCTMTSTQNFNIQPQLGPDPLQEVDGSGRKGIELSCLYRFNTISASASAKSLFQFQWRTSGIIRVQIQEDSNTQVPATLTISAVLASSSINGTASFPITHLDFNANAGDVFQFTVRFKAESAPNANDGVFEFWANGVLKFTVNTISYGTNGQAEELFNQTSSMQMQILSTSGGSSDVRNVICYDGWTSDIGVVPIYSYVVDLIPNAITAPDYTIVRGAATQLVAITDGDDATGIETTIASAEATISFDSDAAFSLTQPQNMSFAFDISKGTIDSNTIDIEALNLSNVVVASTTAIVTGVSPTVQRVSGVMTIPASPSVFVSELRLRVRNGA